MNEKCDLDNFSKDFTDFSKTVPVDPPEDFNLLISRDIHKNLRKDKISAIASVSLIHIVVGIFIIAICPQFDFQIIPNFAGLLTIFMKFGHNMCMFLCGSLFLSSSIVVSAFLLPQTYRRYLYSIRYYKITGLTLGSLVIFALISAVPITFSTILWVCGAILSGHLTSKLYIHRFEVSRAN
jgi:hypothetical protein